MQNILTAGFQQVNKCLSQIADQMKEMTLEIKDAEQQITEVKRKTQDFEKKREEHMLE